MKITILNKNMDVVQDCITPQEASEFLKCSLVNVYKLSEKGWRRHDYYLVRSENYNTLNLVALQVLKQSLNDADPEKAHKYLMACLKAVRND